MKKLMFSLLALLILSQSKAQYPQSIEGTAEFNKTNQPASVLELPYSPELVDAAIREVMQKKGAKPDNTKEYTIYRNVKLNDDDTALADYYFSVERKSKKEKDISIVRVISSKPGTDMKTRLADDKFGIENARRFLDNINTPVAAYDLEVKIKEQEEQVKKGEKKLKNLREDGEDLQKRKKNIEEKIEDNNKDVSNQSKEVENLQKELELLKAKRVVNKQ